jgi:hypothetical protein
MWNIGPVHNRRRTVRNVGQNHRALKVTPGPLQLRGRGSGSRRRAQKARNSRSGSANRRWRSARGVSEHRIGIQVLDPPGRGEFVHVGGDAVDDRSHPHRDQQKFIGDSMQNAIPGFGVSS